MLEPSPGKESCAGDWDEPRASLNARGPASIYCVSEVLQVEVLSKRVSA